MQGKTNIHAASMAVKLRGAEVGFELAHARRHVRLHGVQLTGRPVHGAERRDGFEHFEIGNVHGEPAPFRMPLIFDENDGPPKPEPAPD